MAAGRDSAASSPVRRIVITGASSGLGRALATELALRFPGSTMLLLDRRADRLAYRKSTRLNSSHNSESSMTR